MRLRSGTITNQSNTSSIHNVYDTSLNKIQKYIKKRNKMIKNNMNKIHKKKYLLKLLKYEYRIYREIFKSFSLSFLVTEDNKLTINITQKKQIILDSDELKSGCEWLDFICDSYRDYENKTNMKIIKYAFKIKEYLLELADELLEDDFTFDYSTIYSKTSYYDESVL